jgi:hypothetical protein
MIAVRPNAFLRLMLAASVSAGSVASTPTIGHAHPLPRSLHRAHHDFDAIDHAHWQHSHKPASDDHDDLATIALSESLFHLHTVWFGIPLTLPAPTGHQNEQASRVPLADVCWISGAPAMSTSNGANRERIVVWHYASMLAVDSHAADPLTTNSLRMSPFCGEVGPPCAQPARTGVLRC